MIILLYLYTSHDMKFVQNVPAQSAKFSPFLHECVEEAQPKEEFSPRVGFIVVSEEVGV